MEKVIPISYPLFERGYNIYLRRFDKYILQEGVKMLVKALYIQAVLGLI